MRRLLISLIFVLITCLTQSSEARKLALLVGVDKYDDVPSLKCCVNDVKILKEALLKVGFKEDNIQILATGTDEFPTKRKIERKLKEIFAAAGPRDMVFLSFSGHGAQDGKKVYFCPPDVDLEDLEGTCVSIDQVMLDLENCQAKFKWVVVDACRNDPGEGSRSIGGKGLQVIPTPPAGIALFQSCAKGEQSWEDRTSGNGYFTKNFAAALSGAADANHDGQLTLMEVCAWTTAQTKDQVKEGENKSQKPYFSGTVSDFILKKDINVPKAKELAAEAEKAMETENYKLAIEKYDAALALCPRFTEWNSRKRDAQRLLESQKPKFDPMKINVPDDFPTIEEAYAKVKDGGIITIQPGKYELAKTLVVDRNVTFRGETSDSESVVIDCATSHVFQITSGSPSFQNFTASCSAKATEQESYRAFNIIGGMPKLFRCIITSQEGSGMVIDGKETNPTLEKCILKDCGKSGVGIIKEADGEFKNCEFCGNKECGVLVYEKGRGKFHNCEIFGSTSGIEVSTSGNPTVTGCKIHDGKDAGVLVLENGLGTFNECEIYGNTLAGIAVQTSGNPTVTGCKIHDGKSCGVYVLDGGKGKFNNNTLEKNFIEGELSNWYINNDAGEVKGSGNTPEIPRR